MYWLESPQSVYVIAAYGVAAFFLLGLWLVSWRDYRRKQKDWQKLKSAAANMRDRP